MSLRALVLALLVGLALPALAQQPPGAPAIAVNGQPLPAGAVLGSTGPDLTVMATPFLRAMGAQVRLTGTHLEAWWPGGVLTLDAGSDASSWNGTPGRLSEPAGTMGGDLVVRALEVARLVEARVESGEWGVAIWKSSAAPPGPAASSMPPGAGLNPSGVPMEPGMPMTTGAPMTTGTGGPTLPPGLSMIPAGMTGQLSGPAAGGPQGMPPGLQGDPGPGIGAGQQQQQKAYESPYQRPQVGGEAPAAARPAPSASPGARPPRAVIFYLDARRVMTFHLSTYELKTKIRNEGTSPLARPFQVQLLARGERNPDFELLEAFLVRALGPGEELVLEKSADGHQYQSLQGMTVTFKAVVIEDAPPRSSTYSGAPGPATVEGSSMEKRIEF